MAPRLVPLLRCIMRGTDALRVTKAVAGHQGIAPMNITIASNTNALTTRCVPPALVGPAPAHGGSEGPCPPAPPPPPSPGGTWRPLAAPVGPPSGQAGGHGQTRLASGATPPPSVRGGSRGGGGGGGGGGGEGGRLGSHDEDLLHRGGVRGRADDGNDRAEGARGDGDGGGHLAAAYRRVEQRRLAYLRARAGRHCQGAARRPA